MPPIHIALAFDEKYAPHGGATIASILANAGVEDRLAFHILDGGISPASRRRLQEFVEDRGGTIEFIALDLKRFAALPKTVHTDAMYSRLALPELLPELDRILYLDSDVIVLKSLRSLWESYLPGRLCNAVQDAADVFGSHFHDHKARFGFVKTAPYFNSGVLLINLKAWREYEVSGRVMRFLEQMGAAVRFPDQDALNTVMKDQAIFVDPKWNVQATLIRAVRYGWVKDIEWVAAVRNPAIIHYTGGKPWDFSHVVPRRSDYHRFSKGVAEPAKAKLPTMKMAWQRICAEGMECRWWLAALVKGRLCQI